MKIKRIIYNWFYTSGSEKGEEYGEAEIGKYECTEIHGHIPQGEGDKHYCDIWFKNQTMLRVFNINQILYEHIHVKDLS